MPAYTLRAGVGHLRNLFMRLAYICVFGVLGVLTRYAVGLCAAKVSVGNVPIGTLTVNLLGALLAGMVYVLGVERTLMSPEIRLGIMVGFLGGFTTFSAYCVETVELVEKGEYGIALAYLGLSPVLGFACAFAGMTLARRI
jgi:fluoride exporter